MIRKRDRVVGTLAIWAGALIAMGMTLDRMNFINIQMENAWYYTGSVVTGASSEEAMKILEDVQQISNQYFTQTQQFARAELLAYFPLIVIVCMVLIAAAVISTYFIWRSVVVPVEVSERIEARKSTGEKSTTTLASLLNADGEIIPEQPEHNHRRK
jgi:hypothetical protein